MATLVVGASGATGRLLVEQLLERGQKVRIIVRSTDNLSDSVLNNDNLSVIKAAILDLSDEEMAYHVKGCDAVASCLGHNLSFKGMFGPPYSLVTAATRRLCKAIRANDPKQPVKYILMNTTGNRNRDNLEKVSFAQKCVIGLLRLLLAPHRDNENAADFLRVEIGQNGSNIEWAAVRPDGLIDEKDVTKFNVFPSPIRSAIFDSGVTSRINVGCFMADLICQDALWRDWKGKMPVIYNNEDQR